MPKLIVALLLALPLAMPMNAWAFKRAVVAKDVYLIPDRKPGVKPIAVLRKGAQLVTADQPKDGYYKVRSADGKIGFVRADALSFTAAAPPPPTAARTASAPPEPARERGPKIDRRFRMRVFYGLGMFTMSDLNTQLEFDQLKGGTALGGDMAFRLSRKLGLGVKVDKVSKSVSVPDTQDRTFALSASSMPIMGGLEYTLSESQKSMLRFSVYAGPGAIKFTSSCTAGCTGASVTEFSGSAMAIYPKLDLDLLMGRRFLLSLEAGYKLHSTAKLTPTTTGDGSDLYQNDAATAYVPVALQMTGLTIGLGLGIGF